MTSIRLIDSITELTAADAGCIAVSGSHGGISSARYAAQSQPLLSIFNDAGVGKAGAGIAGLAYLQDHGLAACAVAHTSARIGAAKSTAIEGIISHVNAQADALGVRVHQSCEQAILAAQRHAKEIQQTKETS